MERRVINTEFTAEDAGIENNLRPASLDEYIGQEYYIHIVDNKHSLYWQESQYERDYLERHLEKVVY